MSKATKRPRGLMSRPRQSPDHYRGAKCPRCGERSTTKTHTDSRSWRCCETCGWMADTPEVDNG